MNAIANNPAVTRAIGDPFMPLGTLTISMCSRMPAKMVSAKPNPIAVEAANTNDYAQCLIKRGAYLFQDDFHHLDQCGNYQNESDGLHKADAEFVEDAFLNDEGHERGENHDESQRPRHADSRGNFFRNAQKRADA